MLVQDHLKDRVTRFDEVPRLRPVKAALFRVLAAAEEVRAKHDEVWSDEKISALGRQDTIRKFIQNKTAVELRRANSIANALKDGCASWRARLEKQDSSGSTPLRAELRTLLRGMKHAERIRVLMDPACDAEFHQAVLEGPNILSGCTDDLRGYILEQHINRVHPGQLAAISQAEEAIELLVGAARIAHSETRAAGDFAHNDDLSSFVHEATKGRAAVIDAEAARQFEVA